MTDWDGVTRETAARVLRESNRLIAEWSTSKVRIRHGDLWWRWDGGGYTYDMASAGLYDASFKVWREEDKLVPVNPEAFAIDAIMQRLADAERTLELLERLRTSAQIADLLFDLREVTRFRSGALARLHEELIALLDARKGA